MEKIKQFLDDRERVEKVLVTALTVIGILRTLNSMRRVPEDDE